MQKLGCLALLVSALVVCAWGQTYEVSAESGLARMSKAPLGSVTVDSPLDNDTMFKATAYSYGVRLTYNPYQYYGHEAGYEYTRATLRVNIPDANGNRTLFEDKVAIHQAFYNFLIYFMPKGERWRPFITGGVQAFNYGNPKTAGWTGVATHNYGFNYGGGLKLKLFNHIQARFDLREAITTKPYKLNAVDYTNFSGWLRHREASVGIGIGF
jgi:hypothetical protein